MMATIQFTLQDIMVFLAYVIGIVVGVFLIIILWKLISVVGNVQKLVQDNHQDITKTIKTLPGIMEDVKHISSNAIDISDKVKVSAPVILDGAECVTIAAKSSIEMASSVIENVGSGINETVESYRKDASNVATYVHIAEEVFRAIYKFFTEKK